MCRDSIVSLEGPNVHKATNGVESSLSKSADFESRQLGFAKIADMLGDKLRRAYGRNSRWVFSKWRHNLFRKIKVSFSSKQCIRIWDSRWELFCSPSLIILHKSHKPKRLTAVPPHQYWFQLNWEQLC